jgi:hypothetical protein
MRAAEALQCISPSSWLLDGVVLGATINLKGGSQLLVRDS